MKRRYGTFQISNTELKYGVTDAMRAVFKDMIILEAVRRWNGNCTEYMGECDHFDEISPETETPLYIPMIHTTNQTGKNPTYTVTWVRQ